MTWRVVYGEQRRLLKWASDHLGGLTFRGDAAAIGNEHDGTLKSVVVYDTFSPTSCLVHLTSDGSRRWMTREFLTASFVYPFIQCNLPRITATVSETNDAARRLNAHFGWVEEGRLREDGPNGEDMLVLGMLRRECRFLPAGLRTAAPSLRHASAL